jgi:hypothetical protein
VVACSNHGEETVYYDQAIRNVIQDVQQQVIPLKLATKAFSENMHNPLSQVTRQFA